MVTLTLVSKLITTMWSLLVGPRGGKPRLPVLLRSANSKSVGGSKSRVRAGGHLYCECLIGFGDSREFSSRFLHPSCGDACHVSFLLLMDLLILMLREENPQAKKVVNSRGPAVPTASMCCLSVSQHFRRSPRIFLMCIPRSVLPHKTN